VDAPADGKVGAHAQHPRNLSVYFWRWATWKVFDHHPDSSAVIVCFITVAGFPNGPGFQKMRWYLRRKCDEHVPAAVRFRALPADHRDEKFKALQAMRLDSDGWIECT